MARCAWRWPGVMVRACRRGFGLLVHNQFLHRHSLLAADTISSAGGPGCGLLE
jgi:hypothetical protein